MPPNQGVPGAAEQPTKSSAARRAGSKAGAPERHRADCSRRGVTRSESEATVRPERSRWTGKQRKAPPMRGILLWLVGIPIPIIILLYLFNVL
jgi:hypothetical protein